MAIERDGWLAYFAYGSNMSSERLRGRVGEVEALGRAMLPGHSLRWHKIGADGSGKCDVVAAPEEVVHGVLFRIPSASLPRLDRVEGRGYGYEREKVTALQAGAEVRALTYRATRTDPQLLPYECYQAHVLRGAREFGLPPQYVAILEAAPTKRCARGHQCG